MVTFREKVKVTFKIILSIWVSVSDRGRVIVRVRVRVE